MEQINLEAKLTRLASDLISEITRSSPSIREGTVMTMGPAPYRRLDCDGRALAYVRTRPRKSLVRVDVSGLWLTPSASRIRIPNAGGAATLVIRTDQDRSEAIEYLRSTVERTRLAYEEERDRRRRHATIARSPIVIGPGRRSPAPWPLHAQPSWRALPEGPPPGPSLDASLAVSRGGLPATPPSPPPPTVEPRSPLPTDGEPLEAHVPLVEHE